MTQEEQERVSRAVSASLEGLFGPQGKFLNEILKDDDWGFVIKLHAHLEVSLDRLILSQLNDIRLSKIISSLPVGTEKSGKLEYIVALDLIPKENVPFLRCFSEMRNKFAHKVDYLNFDLKKYFDELDAQKKKQFKSSIKSLIASSTKFAPESTVQKENAFFENMFNDSLRITLYVAAMVIMRKAHLLHSGQLALPSKANPTKQ